MKNWLSIYNLNIESILNGLSDNVYFIDTQGRLIWCNDQQAKSYGFSPNEVIGKTIAELGELSQWSQETIEQLYKNNELIMKMGTPQIFEETVQIGSHIKTFLSHKNALKDSQGNIIGVIGNSTDITQKKSLESIGVNFEEILNTLTNNIYCLDKDGNIIWCNKNQALSLGIPNPAIFIGKTLLNVAEILNWDTTFFKELQKNNMEVIKSGKAKICEETPSTADGSKKTFLSHKNPIFNSNGEVTGLIGIAVDITEKKLNEQLIGEKKQLEKVMESLHTLASSLAHELRTPLVGIQQGTLGLEKYFSKLIESYQIAEAAKLAIPDVPIERLQEVLNNTNKMV
ncbi:MAG: PAS domain-containing protein, partial [Proteobacteria bacterium]|nr:PAS domain-containing protein [Pseudomonadota bacterium]